MIKMMKTLRYIALHSSPIAEIFCLDVAISGFVPRGGGGSLRFPKPKPNRFPSYPPTPSDWSVNSSHHFD